MFLPKKNGHSFYFENAISCLASYPAPARNIRVMLRIFETFYMVPNYRVFKAVWKCQASSPLPRIPDVCVYPAGEFDRIVSVWRRNSSEDNRRAIVRCPDELFQGYTVRIRDRTQFRPHFVLPFRGDKRVTVSYGLRCVRNNNYEAVYLS